MIALHDPHHGSLSQALVYLFEKRLSIELYRPMGREWFDRGAYYHPIEAEAIANLTPADSSFFSSTAPNPHEWQKRKEGLDYFDQDNLKFRWLPWDRLNEVDYLVCTTDRNESNFANLKKKLGLKAKILRFIGNREERCNPENWDIGLFATLKYYDQFKDSKPCVLFHPEFDLNLYSYSPPPHWEKSIVRSFTNFLWHHRSDGDPWHTWVRYWNYCNDMGALALTHGLGTPPHGVEVEMDVILDTCFDRMGKPELKDRSQWPDLRYNQGEPSSQRQIADLMRFSNMSVHIKRGSEGYGFVVNQLAAMGRPMIVEHDPYCELAAFRFMEHKITNLFVSGHDPTDRENLRWALQPENNLRMAQTLHQRFCDNVNFENEARAIAKLL